MGDKGSMRDPYATRWLCNFDPNRPSSQTQRAQTDAIDAEINKIIDEARLRSAVAVAKAEIVDELRANLKAIAEASRG